MLDVNCQLALNGQTFDYQIKTAAATLCLGIQGESGCGKTTLLRIIAGLESAAIGQVTFNGQHWQNSEQKIFVPPEQRHIGFVFQDARLFAHLSVAKNIAFQGKQRKQGSEIEQKAIEFDQIVETLKISHLLDRKPAFLSGGEKQRIAIARALNSQPQRLILDEPLTGIDVENKAIILAYFKELKKSLPMIYVTHLKSELESLSDEVVRVGKSA